MLQGERELAVYNKTIGKFQLTGIPPAPRGMPQVEVTFDIDANGILHVSAKDKTTGKEQKIRIEASSGLSESEIDRMVKDAEKNAAEDKKRREEIDTRNRLDSMTYEVEKNAKEWSDRLSPRAQVRLDGAVERARKALRATTRRRFVRPRKSSPVPTVRLDSLSTSSRVRRRAAARAARRRPEPAGPARVPPAPRGKPDDVVEADYEIVDDKK